MKANHEADLETDGLTRRVGLKDAIAPGLIVGLYALTALAAVAFALATAH